MEQLNNVRLISQETYDDVVKENIIDFPMSLDEARQEAIKQLKAQGISLSNIIKDLAINVDTGRPILNEAVENLQAHVNDASKDKRRLITCLSVLDEECQKSLPHRVLAAKLGAHDSLLTILEQHTPIVTSNDETDGELLVLEKCLSAMNSLINKQPDIFNARALALIRQLLDIDDERIICSSLQWLQKACIMHEMNRQNIMNASIIGRLKVLLGRKSVRIIRDVMAVFRFLVLDDDIRVEFGCAHEHARKIASEAMVDLCQLLAEKYEDVNVLGDLILTLGTLAVRHDYCTTIDNVGGLKMVVDIMICNPDEVRLNREALKLLKALAGNDTVKLHIVQNGAAPIIKELLRTHIRDEALVCTALACISTLTLRVKENSGAFFDAGIVEVIVDALSLHPTSRIAQRNGAWAIRNMVSRSRDQCPMWLSLGVEDLLNLSLREHPSIQQDIKAALRDLGCKVDLKEEWTGTAEKKIINTNKEVENK